MRTMKVESQHVLTSKGSDGRIVGWRRASKQQNDGPGGRSEERGKAAPRSSDTTPTRAEIMAINIRTTRRVIGRITKVFGGSTRARERERTGFGLHTTEPKQRKQRPIRARILTVSKGVYSAGVLTRDREALQENGGVP
jgi:hypothetical protein